MTLLGGTHPRPPAAGHVRHRFTRRHTLRQRSFVRLGAALFAASLALTACGDRSDDDGGDAGSTGGGGGEGKTVKIGVIAPLSGDLSALGLGIQNSVQLAVD